MWPWSRSCAVNALAFSLLITTVNSWPTATSGNSVNTTSLGNDGKQPEYICVSTNWYDVAWFIFANYLLHALSVRSLPGENGFSSTVFKLCCFLVPFTGLRRGLNLISAASNFAPNDLQAAARAKALCMVIRNPDWRPRDGDEIEGCEVELDKIRGEVVKETPHEEARDPEKKDPLDLVVAEASQSEPNSPADSNSVNVHIRDPYVPPKPRNLLERCFRIVVQSYRFRPQAPSEASNRVVQGDVKIHGLCTLPDGYGLVYVPEDIKVFPRMPARGLVFGGDSVFTRYINAWRTSDTKVASTHDIPRILFSIVQTISGGYSLYRAQGSQIERYGWGAYGLTVLPYIVVSIVNFIGSLLTSEYETVYLVHSNVMDEMATRGGVVDGVIGSIQSPDSQEQRTVTVEMEDHVPLEGKTILFHGSDHDVWFNGSEKSLRLKPYEAPEAKKRKKVACFRFQDIELGSWLDHHFLAVPQEKLYRMSSKETVPGPSISIPSHPSFTRLRPAPYQQYLSLLTILLMLMAIATPYTVIAALSGFKKGQATGNQLAWTLNWLVVGQIQGLRVGQMERHSGRKSSLKGLWMVFAWYGSSCIMGLIVVGQEMLQIGTCEAL